MKITGYKLREAIKEWSLKKELAEESFNDALFAFKDEEKDALEFINLYEKAENAIVKLQNVQVQYNNTIQVSVNYYGNNVEKMSLALAVKEIGGIGRVAKLWRQAKKAKAVCSTYLGESRLIRKDDEEVAKKTISDAVCAEQLTAQIKKENKLRAAIAAANAVEINLDLDAGLFS